MSPVGHVDGSFGSHITVCELGSLHWSAGTQATPDATPLGCSVTQHTVPAGLPAAVQSEAFAHGTETPPAL
jgi:hypothetical protein